MSELTELSEMDEEVLRCWQARLLEMVPSYGRSLEKDAALTLELRTWSHRVLGLVPPAH